MFNKKQPDAGSFTRLVEQRRSSRSYLSKQPPREWINEMLNCARWAPSPSNQQPVRFVLVESEKIKSDLKNALEEGKDRLLALVDEKGCSKKLKNQIRYYFRHSSFAFTAPCLFAAGLSKKKEGFTARLARDGLIEETYLSDTSDHIALGLALDNFILKGTELGLGTCILTAPLLFLKHSRQWPVFPGMTLTSFITAGFPDKAPAVTSRKPVTEIFRTV
ncbi:MAG: nitroreductase family protein [Desulfobacteraceae bacterium]